MEFLNALPEKGSMQFQYAKWRLLAMPRGLKCTSDGTKEIAKHLCYARFGDLRKFVKGERSSNISIYYYRGVGVSNGI